MRTRRREGTGSVIFTEIQGGKTVVEEEEGEAVMAVAGTPVVTA